MSLLSALSRELAAHRPADHCSMSSPSDSSGRLRTRVSAGGSTHQSGPGLLQGLGGVACIGKRFLDRLRLRDQLGIERRSHDVSTLLRLFQVEHQPAVAHRVSLAHEQLLIGDVGQPTSAVAAWISRGRLLHTKHESSSIREATPRIESNTEIGDVMAPTPSINVSDQAAEFLSYLVQKRAQSILRATVT